MRRSIFALASTAFLFFSGMAGADCAAKAEQKLQEGLWDEAFAILEPCAENSDRDAQARLGALYWSSQAGRHNDALAIYWTKRAAESGSLLALGNLAHALENGKLGVQANTKEAARLYRSAVEAGDDTARFRLAQMALLGRGMSKNEDLALDLLKGQKEALTGPSGDAEYQIASIYKVGYDGSGEGVDLVLAQHFYDISARKGHRGAQYFLGTMLLESKEKTEIVRGLVWIAMAAKSGHRLALEDMDLFESKVDEQDFKIIEEKAHICIENSYNKCP
jgi:TPR repeat protein